MAEYKSTSTQGHTPQSNGPSLEGGLTDAASQATAGLMGQVKSRASAQVSAQQTKAADGLGSMAKALRTAGNELRSHNEGLASYADMAVDELEHISRRLREKSPGEYVDDLERFARNRPVAFLGGTFLLGLGLARFLKSSQPNRGASRPGAHGYRTSQASHSSGAQAYSGQIVPRSTPTGVGTSPVPGAARGGAFGGTQASGAGTAAPQRSHTPGSGSLTPEDRPAGTRGIGKGDVS